MFMMVYFYVEIMSTLLGCVIAEHGSMIHNGTCKCCESFVMHLIRMIMVCIIMYLYYWI